MLFAGADTWIFRLLLIALIWLSLGINGLVRAEHHGSVPSVSTAASSP